MDEVIKDPLTTKVETLVKEMMDGVTVLPERNS